MTQQDKDNLLLRDLSARVLYKTKCQIEVFSDKESKLVQTVGILFSIEKFVNYCCAEFEYQHEIFDRIETRYTKIIVGEQLSIKPYLRRLSSMTEEERNEYKHLIAFSGSPNGSANFVDWLNKKMFAYRVIDGKDMFELGLALEAPKGMYNLD